MARLGTEAARAEENAIQKLLGGDPLPEIKDIPRVPHAVHYYNLAPAPVPAPVPDVGAPPQPVQPANPEHPSPGVIAAALVISFIITMIILGVTIALLNSQPRKAHDQSLFQVIIFTNVLSLISQLIGIFPNPDARRVAGVIAALTILFHLGEAITFCVKLGEAYSCDNAFYISFNELIAGSTSRCKMVKVDTVFLFLGKSVSSIS